MQPVIFNKLKWFTQCSCSSEFSRVTAS